MHSISLREKPVKDDSSQHQEGCLICGQPLVYSESSEMRECVLCHRSFPATAACVNGHFVCDDCHSIGAAEFLPLLLNTPEKDPVKILQRLMALKSVHMHGPEHHILVPAALLTAYKNCGGEIDLGPSLKEAFMRGKQVPGGACGNWGMCGAASGAGIFASIVYGSTPLNKEAWPKPILLTSRCLERISDVGGPRCCKRTAYISIQTAVDFSGEFFKVSMPRNKIQCHYTNLNKECIRTSCPFYVDIDK